MVRPLYTLFMVGTSFLNLNRAELFEIKIEQLRTASPCLQLLTIFEKNNVINGLGNKSVISCMFRYI